MADLADPNSKPITSKMDEVVTKLTEFAYIHLHKAFLAFTLKFR